MIRITWRNLNLNRLPRTSIGTYAEIRKRNLSPNDLHAYERDRGGTSHTPARSSRRYVKTTKQGFYRTTLCWFFFFVLLLLSRTVFTSNTPATAVELCSTEGRKKRKKRDEARHKRVLRNLHNDVFRRVRADRRTFLPPRGKVVDDGIIYYSTCVSETDRTNFHRSVADARPHDWRVGVRWVGRHRLCARGNESTKFLRGGVADDDGN